MSTHPKLYILCVDDESSVLEAVERDLASLEAFFPLESAEDAAQAKDLVRQIYAAGDKVAVILCDHLMPGQTGVDFLIELNRNAATAATRKVLLTGQAGHQDTIDAVNQAGLHHYISKPWKVADLVATVRTQLTEFVLAENIDPTSYLAALDAVRIAEAIRSGGIISDR